MSVTTRATTSDPAPSRPTQPADVHVLAMTSPSVRTTDFAAVRNRSVVLLETSSIPTITAVAAG